VLEGESHNKPKKTIFTMKLRAGSTRGMLASIEIYLNDKDEGIQN